MRRIAELETEDRGARQRRRRVLGRRRLVARRRARRTRARRARARGHRGLARAGAPASSTARARWPTRSASRTRRSRPTSSPARATARNDRDRCYHCKTELYERLAALARARGYRGRAVRRQRRRRRRLAPRPARGGRARRPAPAARGRRRQGRRARARAALGVPSAEKPAIPVPGLAHPLRHARSTSSTLRQIDAPSGRVQAPRLPRAARPPPRRARPARARRRPSSSARSARTSEAIVAAVARPATPRPRSPRSRSAPARSTPRSRNASRLALGSPDLRCSDASSSPPHLVGNVDDLVRDSLFVKRPVGASSCSRCRARSRPSAVNLGTRKQARSDRASTPSRYTTLLTTRQERRVETGPGSSPMRPGHDAPESCALRPRR